MGIGLTVDGVPIHLAVGHAFGGLEWSTLADGGSGDITWSMQLPVGFTHPAIRRGRLVQVRAGGTSLCAGIMAAPTLNTDDDGGATWNFVATGLKSQGAGLYAMDAAGNTTAIPDTAIDANITNYGLRWKRPVSLSSTAFTEDAPSSGDQTDALNKVNDLLNVWSKSVSKRWGVDGNCNVYAAADPTTPTLYLSPQAGRFGLADDDYASTVLLRYMTSNGTYATASATDQDAADEYEPRQVAIDGTSYGVLSSSKANGLVQGGLAAGSARLGYTNSITPNRWQLTTPGGTPVPWWMPRGQELVRIPGVVDEQTGLPYLDFVLGEAHHVADDQAVVLSPVGLVDRDVASNVATAMGLAS